MKTVLAIVVFSLCLAGCGKKEEMPELKACVDCREDVKFMAAVCKHCGADPDGPDGPVKRAAWSKIEEEMPKAVKLARLRDNFDVQIEELKKRHQKEKDDDAAEANRKAGQNRLAQDNADNAANNAANNAAKEKNRLENQLGSVKAELEQLMVFQKAAREELERNTVRLDKAHGEVSKATQIAKATKNELQEAQQLANRLRKELTDLKEAYGKLGTPKEIKSKLDELAELKAVGVPPKVKPEPKGVAGGKVGKITNVDPRYGVVILNRGSDHGFKIGDQFNVFRNNKLIGRIEVTRLSGTNKGMSVALRVEGLGVPAGAQFQVNDDLVKLK